MILCKVYFGTKIFKSMYSFFVMYIFHEFLIKPFIFLFASEEICTMIWETYFYDLLLSL